MKRTFIFSALLAAITLVATSCDQSMTSVAEPDQEAHAVSAKVQDFLDAGGEIHVQANVSLRKHGGPPPSYWVSEIGTNLNMGDDDSRGMLLPFPFTFYGAKYPKISINSNGNVTLNMGNRGWNHTNVPDGGYVLIAPLYGDFNPSADGYGGANDVYYNVVGTAPNRFVVITWNVVPEFSNDGQNTFQTVLSEGSNEILFGYNGLDTDGINWNGSNMNVGISFGTGRYINVASGTEIPALDGTNILFTPQGDGYSVSYDGGPPGFPGGPANTDPVADAGDDQTVECTGPGGTDVTLDGSASSDDDDDDLTYSWTDGDGAEVSTEASFAVALGLGTHTFTLTVDDGNGGTASDEVLVTVEDTTPPVIDLTVETTTIWPVNGRMVLAVSAVSATDVCCDVSLTVDVSGTAGDANDWAIVDNGDGTYNVSVRAERSGREKGGRVYTITVTATDCAGNQAVATVAATVPHDQGRGKK